MLAIGTNISLFVGFDDRGKKEAIFQQLAEGGKILFEINEEFGMVTDKFGIQWMFIEDH